MHSELGDEDNEYGASNIVAWDDSDDKLGANGATAHVIKACLWYGNARDELAH